MVMPKCFTLFVVSGKLISSSDPSMKHCKNMMISESRLMVFGAISISCLVSSCVIRLNWWTLAWYGFSVTGLLSRPPTVLF